MVAEFVKLKLSLLGNTFVRTPRQNVRVIVTLIVCLAAAAGAVAVLLSLPSGSPGHARTVIVLGGSLVVLAFAIVPLVTGVPDALDPQRLSLMGLSSDAVARGSAVAGLVSVPVLLLVLVAAVTVPVWAAGHAGIALLAVLMAIIAVMTCVIASRITSLIAALGLSSRRARETALLVVLLLLVLASPAIVLWVSSRWGSDGSEIWESAAAFLSWTPLGSVWAVPSDAAMGGQVGVVLLKSLIAVAFLGIEWFVWRALVAHVLVSTKREENAREHTNLGWFARTPATPAGAVAARSLTYWARDPRYSVPVIGAIIIFVLMAGGAFLVVGLPLTFVPILAVPAFSATLAFSVHNDVALDNSAVWLHVSAGKVGLADRIGRIVPALAIGFPVIAIGSVAATYFNRSFEYLPALLGISTVLLLAGLGLGSLLSALFPYAAVRPGDGPFEQPQSSAGSGIVVQIILVLAMFVLAAPSIVYGILGMTGDESLFWASLWWGVGVGLVTLVAGVVSGAVAFDRRGPDILATALRN